MRQHEKAVRSVPLHYITTHPQQFSDHTGIREHSCRAARQLTGSSAQKVHYKQEVRTKETLLPTPSHLPMVLSILFCTRSLSESDKGASSVLLPWLYFLHLCYHTGYVLPKARILSRHCTPIVNHEKTREELPQLTDLESSELDKELIHLGFYLTH